jgi:hypothetical protein
MSSSKKAPRLSRYAPLHGLADVLEQARDNGNGASTVPVSAVSLLALAGQLRALAAGESPEIVFSGRRRSGGAPSRSLEASQRSFAYWRARVEGRTDAEAIALARRVMPDCAAMSAARIRRAARAHRDVILGRLEVAEYRVDKRGRMQAIPSPLAPKVAKFREYLYRKSEHWRD